MERLKLPKLFHETVGRRIAEFKAKAVDARLKELKHGEYFLKEKPIFISQLAGAKPSMTKGFYGEITDRKAAERFGANSNREFSYWGWRACGIVDLQMILATLHHDGFSKTTMDLVEEGLKLGGYDVANDVGWYHKALASLGRKYGLESTVKKFIPSSKIAEEIIDGKYVLASIKSEMGGHLLLVYGFRLGSEGLKGFWLHDPNTYNCWGQNSFVAKDNFDALFTRRVITFEKGGN